MTTPPPALATSPAEPQDPADHDGIRRTMGRYCHLVDQGRFQEFADVWTPDAVMEVPGEDNLVGRDAIVTDVERRQPPERRGQHVTINQVIDVHGDQAEAVSNFVFLARTRRGFIPLLMGRYEDELRRDPDGWRFTRRRVILAESAKEK